MATPEQVAAVIEPIAPPAPVPKQKKAKKAKAAQVVEEVAQPDIKPVILDLTVPDETPALFVPEEQPVEYEYLSDDDEGDDSSSGGYTLWNMVTAFFSGGVTGAALLAAAIGYLSALEEKKAMEEMAQMLEAKRRFIAEQETQLSELAQQEKPQP
jgi:hypothetical protein